MAIEDPSLIVYFNSYKRPFIDDVQATPVCLAEGNLPVSVSIRLAVTSIWPRIRMVGSWQLLWLLNVAAFWGSISKWLRLCKISEWFGMNPHCPIAIYIYLRLLTSYSTVHLVDLVVVFFTSTLHQVVYWYRKDGQMATRILDHSIGPGFSCSWEDLNNAPWQRSLRTHWWEKKAAACATGDTLVISDS
jgi:hypothetical protein